MILHVHSNALLSLVELRKMNSGNTLLKLMVTQELIEYIKQRQTEGKTKDQIQSDLEKVGWSLIDIQTALDTAFPLPKRDQTLTPVVLSSVPLTTSNNQSEGELLKPKSVTVVSFFYWILAWTSLGSSLLGGSTIQIMNNAMKIGQPGSLDYSFIRAVPFVPLFSIFGVISCLAYFYAAFRISSGSKTAWKIGLFTIIGVDVFGVLYGLVIALLMGNLYAKTASF